MMDSHSKELVAHQSISDLVTKGYLSINSVTRIVGVCPYCDGELREYIEPEGTPPRCPPFCMHEEFIEGERGKRKSYWSGCGYRAMKKREDKIVANKYQEALKTDAIGFMKKNSIFTNTSIWDKDFNSYQEMDDETRIAKKKALTLVNDFLTKNEKDKIESKAHAVLTGKTGTGKTHLSMAIIYEYLKLSGYEQQVLLVSYRELLEQLKFAMNDSEAQKKITGEVMREIKRADLVLIDDIGAQLGNPLNPNKPSNYDIDTMNSLTEAREERATIITMNLTSLQIKQLYGDRVYSRIVNNVGDRFIKFEETTDKRVNGI